MAHYSLRCSESTANIRCIAIPVLALSNNIQSASPGNWVLGYLPEQQIDHLLGYAIGENKTRIAILASEDPFGRQILNHAAQRLAQFGLQPSQTTMLAPADLADEGRLKDAIKRSVATESQKQTKLHCLSQSYDVLILAGQPDLFCAPPLFWRFMS